MKDLITKHKIISSTIFVILITIIHSVCCEYIPRYSDSIIGVFSTFVFALSLSLYFIVLPFYMIVSSLKKTPSTTKEKDKRSSDKFIAVKKLVVTLLCFIIVIVILITLFLFVKDSNVKKITLDTFKQELSKEDFIFTEVSGVESVNIVNSKITFAEREDIQIFYIDSIDESTAKDNYNSIISFEQKNCTSPSMNYKYSQQLVLSCNNTNRFIDVFRRKNVIIYAISNANNKIKVLNALDNFKWSNNK